MSRTRTTGLATVKTRGRWVVVLPWALVIFLAVSNVGTLVNARLHAAGFRAVESVLTAFGPYVAERILSRSPTLLAERRAVLARGIVDRTRARLVTHATRSVATVPERVAPVLGTGAVVAFTLYDVQTDCATAADMNEILATLGQQEVDTGALCRLADRVPSVSKAWSMAKVSASGVQRTAIDLVERMLGSPK